MGRVWAAADQVLHRQVAIKEIDFPPGTPAAERAQLEARTLREARAIASLSNPYVITLFDILTLEQGPVIVMELLRARSLAEILRQVGRLPDGQAATIGVAVASGLIAAHAAGITHRDVKPGNVLICDDGRIKLTDFGIARSSAEQTMTATGLLLGSPAYIAPEVANGVPVGPVSDAWSLGGLLFATVEGRPPFDQRTAIATLTSVVKDPVPPHPHSGRLGAVVSGLLVKTPSLRMRIDRALAIMRTVADDPSGMNLVAASRLPRNEDTSPGLPPIKDASTGPPGGGTASQPVRTGTAAHRHETAGPPLPRGSNPVTPAGSSARPSASPAQPGHSSAPPDPGMAAGPRATAPRRSRATGTGWGRPPGDQPWSPGAAPAPGSPPSRSALSQATGGQPAPPPHTAAQQGTAHQERSRARTPPPDWSRAATSPPGTSQAGTSPAGTRQAGPSQPRTKPPGPRPSTSRVQIPPDPARDSQHLSHAALEQALPPPPWAPADAAALPPLPQHHGATGAESQAGERHSTRLRWIAAALIAIIAAVVGFLGVRVIADLAGESAGATSAGAAGAAARAADDAPPAWNPAHTDL